MITNDNPEINNILDSKKLIIKLKKINLKDITDRQR